MKLAGIDLNGERARAARNWRDDDDMTTAAESIAHVDAGWSPVVVRAVDPDGWIGGAQAALAPHGRGPGWGDAIGRDDRRLGMEDVLPWRGNGGWAQPDAAPFRAAVDALAGDARLVALVVPDDGTVDEKTQDVTLRALSGPRRPRVELVWRPVAILLGLLERLPAPQSDDAATEIAVVSDLDGHLAVSRLMLRRLPWAGRVLLAPERRRPGTRWPWAGAAATRVARLRRIAGEAIGLTSDALGRQTRQAEALVATGLAAPGVVRMPNAAWAPLEPPLEPGPTAPLPEGLADWLAGADAVVAESPAGAFAERGLAALLRASASAATILEAAEGAPAAGALEAARRFALGAPPWLDFLPGLDAVVTDAEGDAVFDNLIPPTAFAPAGTFWVCASPPAYGLHEGQTAVDLYFEKLDQPGVRKWRAPLPEPAPGGSVVRLRVQQRPAAGHAAIVVESEDWAPLRGRPIHLDWKDLDTEPRDRATLLSDLNPPLPVPNRYYYPADIAHWSDGVIEAALHDCLDHPAASDPRRIRALHVLYDRFKAQSPPGATIGGMRRHAVDTDGALPEGLGPDVVALWRRALESAAADVRTVADGRGPTGQPPRIFYKFPTWCFTACPPSIIGRLVEAETALLGHRLIEAPADRTVALHGIGRCMTGAQAIADFIGVVVGRQGFDALSLACVAFLTSRRDEAAAALGPRPDLVEALARMAAAGLRQPVGNNWGNSFPRYALELSIGLVRVRRARRSALTPRSGPGANDLVAALHNLVPRAPANRRPIVEDAADWVRGKGKNPDILMSLG